MTSPKTSAQEAASRAGIFFAFASCLIHPYLAGFVVS